MHTIALSNHEYFQRRIMKKKTLSYASIMTIIGINTKACTNVSVQAFIQNL